MTAPRIQRTGRRQWTVGQRVHVQYGLDVMAHGWGIGIGPDPATIPPEVLAEMRACWFDHRDEIIRDHAQEQPGKVPWGRTVFEQEAPR